MFTLTVNGREVTCEEDKKLIRFLRDDLHLMSVKDGCSEGACGTCHVIIDGKAVKACVPTVKRSEGKSITTVEGLSQEEKDAFVYAFGRTGAVQCGFCIPGMVICGKNLIDQNPNPTRDDIKNAIKNNICRCTGYVKIIDGIELAAKILRGEETIQAESADGQVGSDITRLDVAEKVLGTGLYADDYVMDDLLYASPIKSKYPRAIVKNIDASAALAMDGVVAVYTADDVPVNKVGHIRTDWDVLIPVGTTTRYTGDNICLVVAESEAILAEAKKAVQIDYEELEPVTDPREALKEDAPKVHSEGNMLTHEHLVKGDPEAARAKCKYIVSDHFKTPFTEHAFLEPECCISMPYKDGIKLITSDQGVYATRHEVSHMLDWPEERVYVENALVGGGFGGKEDMSVQHLAALVTYITGKKCKIKFTRQESIITHPKRHAADMEFTIGCDENGIFQFMQALIYFDTGAYASLGGPVLQRACTHAAGPYNYQNMDIEGYGVYTNNVPGGAYRGFGVCQSCFAIEALINRLADETGLSDWEIRYRNAIRPGQVLPNGQIADPSTALAETLEAVKPWFDSEKHVGLACGLKNAGVGVGLPDMGRCKMVVQDGLVYVQVGASDIGQGSRTVFWQMTVSATGLPADRIVVPSPSTEFAPNSGVTSGSRQTLVSGEAVRRAGTLLKNELDAGKTLADLEGQEFYAEYLAKTDPMGIDKPNPVSHVAYGYATHLVCLDDNGECYKVVAAHGVGKIVNPQALGGQIEGGVVMGLGYGLTEDYPLDNGVPKGKYGNIGLFKANKIPEIEVITIEKPGIEYAYGAIGVGELATIPTAPACQGAYYRLDGEFRKNLPLENTAYKKAKKKR
ncbi:MAG: selenium-dependent xanthine dehydrogenase [Eubacteriales bacterium]|nr:selenium-dependent xanthine dehydrogenase [Eubacteriales bacterium]